MARDVDPRKRGRNGGSEPAREVGGWPPRLEQTLARVRRGLEEKG
ncbi:MAG: hypothetical protein ACT4PT_02805 [Methanobacteriota archaeon]